MEIELIETRNEVNNIISFIFNKPPGFEFKAGDFVELGINYIDGGGDKRWITIASSPTENSLMFTMKIPPKPSAFKYDLSRREKGSKAYISPAIGQFNLPRLKDKKIIFIAGGVGITPYRSMLLSPEAKQYDITLLYIAPGSEHIYKEELRSSEAKIHLLDAKHYRLNESLLDDYCPNWQSQLIYCSGPEKIMEAFTDRIRPKLLPSQIKVDYFTGYSKL